MDTPEIGDGNLNELLTIWSEAPGRRGRNPFLRQFVDLRHVGERARAFEFEKSKDDKFSESAKGNHHCRLLDVCVRHALLNAYTMPRIKQTGPMEKLEVDHRVRSRSLIPAPPPSVKRPRFTALVERQINQRIYDRGTIISRSALAC